MTGSKDGSVAEAAGPARDPVSRAEAGVPVHDRESASKVEPGDLASRGSGKAVEGRRSSLRDRLKAALRDAELSHFSGNLPSGAAGTRDEDLAQDSLGAIVHNAIGAADGDSTKAGAIQGRPAGFTMAGSETEAEIRSLTKDGTAKEASSLASLEATLGSADISLFTRISRSLRRRERERYVSRQKRTEFPRPYSAT